MAAAPAVGSRRSPRPHGWWPTRHSAPPPAEEPDDHGTRAGILGRRDPVPAGVQAQLTYFMGGVDPDACADRPRFGISVEDHRVKLGLAAPAFNVICLYDVRPGSPVRVTVTAPSGRVVQTWSEGVLERGPIDLLFRRLADDEPGVYRFRAVQGGRTATTTARLRWVRSPWLIADAEDANGTPVDTFPEGSRRFRIAVGGFPPHALVRLHIYGNPRDEPGGVTMVDYLTSHPVRMDGRGFGVWELRALPGDPPGCYLAGHESLEGYEVEFCVPDRPPVRE
ncbi:hypothetical protein [Paractinoplanes rishiriensis]|uniref:Uncharacterized protein n=1 Tax=Paractinoplanes rishiriensis TaxID=1050105 RepID=A0A919K6V3_9ACTN|nr:hypothetical protein [Actinoplanes rishiriensis]GIF00443.1 hypothetical protein Ari01nite_79070 [Actinoplanes rishiriensis]